MANVNHILILLDDLIVRIANCTYHSYDDIYDCTRDVNAYVLKVIPNSNYWVNKIHSVEVSMGTYVGHEPDGLLANAWEHGKEELLDIMTNIRKVIVEHFNVKAMNNAKVVLDTSKLDKVFIVHGHDEAMKLSVARSVEKLGLKPIILHEQPNAGRTIIEKFESFSEDVGFAIVLLSADDEMFDGKQRARQNVILELGYFYAKLGRKKVVVLHNTSNGGVEIPSDIFGIIYEPYDNPDGAWQFKLVQELKIAGFDADANALL